MTVTSDGRAARGGTWMFRSATVRIGAATALASIFGAATTPVLAWTASPAVVGQFNLFTVYVGLATVACSFGQDQAYLRFYYQVEDARRLLWRTMRPALVSVLIVSAALCAFPTSASQIAFGQPSAAVCYALAAGAVAGTVYRFATVQIRMAAHAGALLVNQVLPKIVVLGGLSIAVWVGVEPTLALPSWLFVLGTGAAVLVWAPTVWREQPHAAHEHGVRPTSRHLVGYGLPLMGSALAFWLVGAVGALGLKWFSSTEELASYALALSFALPATLAQVVLASVWAPAVFKWTADEASRLVPKCQQVGSAVMLCAFATLGFCSWFVGFLIPSSYHGVEFLVPMAMASPLLYAQSELMAVGLNLSRRTWMMGFASAVAAAVAVCLVGPLAGAGGAAGALAAMMIANAVMLLLRTEFAARAWLVVPRLHVYASMLVIAAASVGSAVIGPALGAGVLVAWVLLACFGVTWLFRQYRDWVGDRQRPNSEAGEAR